VKNSLKLEDDYLLDKMTQSDQALKFLIDGIVGFKNGTLETWILNQTNHMDYLYGNMTAINKTRDMYGA
jgi:hypothetical protein